MNDGQTVRPGVSKKFLTRLDPDRMRAIPLLAALLFRLHHRTCQFTILGKEHEEAGLRGGGPMLLTTWHFAFPAVIYRYRDSNGLLMVSRSRDGEWVSRVLQHLGYRFFRGSPGKGGSTALKQLISHVRLGPGGGFIADGSQGPPRVAQKGILLLARYSQAPLVPVSMAAKPCWRFRSWDRTVLAKPFSRVVMAYGKPIRVPRDVSPEELERLRLLLERNLNDLTEQCEAAVGAVSR